MELIIAPLRPEELGPTEPCPQQGSATMGVQLAHQTQWENRDGGYICCSYCGSLSPYEFFAAIERGNEVVPTDKNYKAYVIVPNKNAGKKCVGGSANHKPDYGTWVHPTEEEVQEFKSHGLKTTEWVMWSTEGETKQKKFYYEHLKGPHRQKFVDLLNAKKINVGYPGHFYRLPFFCVPLTK